MPKSVTFVVNGKLKRRANSLEIEAKRLLDPDFEVTWKVTEKSGDAIAIARNATETGSQYIIAVGGDGTVNEVVNGIMLAEPVSLRMIVIVGVLPYGTGNDFAKRTLKVSAKLSRLREGLLNPKTWEIDVGQAHYHTNDGASASRYFVNIADVGIGADIVQRVASSSKIFGSSMSYLIAGGRSLLAFTPRRVRITSPEYSFEGRCLAVVLANGSSFGSGVVIAPQAKPDDGKIQVVVLAELGMMDYLRHLGHLKKGKVINHKQVFYASVSQCQIDTCDDSALALEIDGEVVGVAPVAAELTQKAIRFLVP